MSVSWHSQRRSSDGRGCGMSPVPVPSGSWRLWVDTGGTFTDCIAVDPGGFEHRVKILSTSAIRGIVEEILPGRQVRVALPFALPEGFFAGCLLRSLGGSDEVAVETSTEGGVLSLGGHCALKPGSPCEIQTPDEAPVLAARVVTGTPVGQALPEMSMRLATTRATNALLERSGAATALFITRGLGDLLEIGTQQRPDLFALEIIKPKPLYCSVVEVDERLDAAGETLQGVDRESIGTAAATLRADGVQSAAVALLHSYRNPAHEQIVKEVLESHGFEHISCSADLAPLMRLLPRAETAVVDAYLAPLIESYLAAVSRSLAGGRLEVMTSAGGLTPAAGFRPKESLLSGPAGGVVGAARAGRASGWHKLISFDMGGTSTDVARYDGDYEYQFETRVGEARILAPALAIETVAAGGGSICRFDGRQLKVGPASAGASPGPACYGSGGPLTLTDVNLLLGRLDSARFEIPLSVEAAEQAADEAMDRLRRAHSGLSLEEMLHGFLGIADERMAEVIRRISVRRGYDPADYTLVAFGGAGAQHAVAVASRLGLRRVVVPRDASLLSARGLGHALVEHFVERQILEPAEVFERRIVDLLADLDTEACEAIVAQGVDAGSVEVRRRIVAVRLAGQESTLEVVLLPGRPIVELFAHAYQERFGYPPPDRQVEVESVRVVASIRREEPSVALAVGRARPMSGRMQRCHLGGSWREVPCLEREQLAAGDAMIGPLLVQERFSTTVVEPGWCLRVDGAGALILEGGAT